MNGTRKEFFEGLGLSVLALFFTGLLLIAAGVAAGREAYVRTAVFALPGLLALYWSVCFTFAQIAAYRVTRGR